MIKLFLDATCNFPDIDIFRSVAEDIFEAEVEIQLKPNIFGVGEILEVHFIDPEAELLVKLKYDDYAYVYCGIMTKYLEMHNLKL